MKDDKRTYGIELEWADIDTRTDISAWGKWDTDERTICNTDGTAFKFSHIGGEAVTLPTDSIDSQIELIENLREALQPNLSHRCGTHVHVRIPGLSENVDQLKDILRYIVHNAPAIDNLTVPECYVDASEYPEDPEIRRAIRGYNQMTRSWLRLVPPTERLEELYAAETPEEFYQAHYPMKKDGTGRVYATAPRYAVNLRSIHKHGTVEFRHFGGSTEPEVIRGLYEYCDTFLTAALEYPDEPITNWLLDGILEKGWTFPEMQPFDAQAEVMFHRTKVS